MPEDKERIPGLNKYSDPVVRTAYTTAYTNLYEALSPRFSAVGPDLPPRVRRTLSACARMYAQIRVEPYLQTPNLDLKLEDREQAQIGILLKVVPPKILDVVKSMVGEIMGTANQFIAENNLDRESVSDGQHGNLASKFFGYSGRVRFLRIAEQTGLPLSYGYRTGVQPFALGSLVLDFDNLVAWQDEKGDQQSDQLAKEFMNRLFKPVNRPKRPEQATTKILCDRWNSSPYYFEHPTLPIAAVFYATEGYERRVEAYRAKYGPLGPWPKSDKPAITYGVIGVVPKNLEIDMESYRQLLLTREAETKKIVEGKPL